MHYLWNCCQLCIYEQIQIHGTFEINKKTNPFEYFGQNGQKNQRTQEMYDLLISDWQSVKKANKFWKIVEV